MASKPNQLKSCGMLVVLGSPPREFLLMQHADRYDLPKGHVDPGETEMQCALREMQEETGLQADDVVVDPHFRFTTTYPVRSSRTSFEVWEKTLVIFLCTLKRPRPIVTTEHLGYRWFPWQPPHHIQPMTIDPLLARLADFLGQDAP